MTLYLPHSPPEMFTPYTSLDNGLKPRDATIPRYIYGHILWSHLKKLKFVLTVVLSVAHMQTLNLHSKDFQTSVVRSNSNGLLSAIF